jgi:hypothetical protein
LQPHQAVAEMREFLVGNCVKVIAYYGRNNVRYTRTLTPSPGKVQISALVLCYMPHQTFVLRIGHTCHEGEVVEQGSPPCFRVKCSSLTRCSVCGGVTSATNQILCALCFKPAHKWGLLSPDSFQCKKCNALICRSHAVRRKGQLLCSRCGPGGRPLRARWLPHCLFGLGVSTLTAAAVVALSGNQLVAGAVVLAAGWIPLLGLLLRPLVSGNEQDLVYPKVQAATVP